MTTVQSDPASGTQDEEPVGRAVPCAVVDGRPTELPGAGRCTTTLLDWLRREPEAGRVRAGCLTGHCGVCTVLLDGQPVVACCTPAAAATGRRVETAREVARSDIGRRCVDAFVAAGAFQCGYCAPGVLVVVTDWLHGVFELGDDLGPETEQHLREALRGSACRCTGYQQLIEAVMDVVTSEREAQA